MLENIKNLFKNKKAVIILAASILAVIALIVAAVLIIPLVLNNDDEPDTPASGEWAGVGIYYNIVGKECELTLNKDGSFVLLYNGSTKTGSYTEKDSVLTLSFGSSAEERATASYENGIVTLTWDGATMRLWKKVEYTVKFETNGGTQIADVKVMNGKTVAKPADPTKEDFIFVGWYKDSGYTQPFTFSSDIITADTTIYARWIEDSGVREYTISFDVGYAGGEALSSKPTLGGRLFGAPVPQREGFIFGGWWISTDNDSSKLSYRLTEEIVFTEDTTLFALWREVGSTQIEAPSLKVDENGASWNFVSGARSYDVTVTDANGTVLLSRATSTSSISVSFRDYPAGVYFVKVVACANTGEADNSESFFTYVNKGLDKVGGLFVSGDSTLVFGGVPNAEKYLITVVCGNAEHQHTDFDNGSSKTFSFANCTMAKDGIKFIVKAVAQGYLTSVSNEFVYKKDLASPEGFEWDEQTGILRWDPVENAQDYMVSVLCGNALHSHSLVRNNGETFVDLKECSPIDGEITVAVYPIAEGYVSPDPTQTKVNKSILKTPGGVTVSGTVIGWNADDQATKYELSVNGTPYEVIQNSFDLSTLMGAEPGARYEIRLRAIGETTSVWSNPIVCYSLAFGDAIEYVNGVLHWNHVLGADFYEVQVNDGEIAKVSGTNRASITFDRAGENTIKLRFVKGETPSEWSSIQITAYSVTFDTLGGSALDVQFKAVSDEIELPTSTKTGYRFVSWYNVPGGASVNGKEIIGATFRVTENVTLYAYYVPEKYEIQYNYGLGGNGSGVNGIVEYQKDYILEVPTADEITVSFGGWFSAPYGKGTQYTDGSGKSLVPWNQLGGAEVYAFWIDETLTFTPVKVNGKNVYSVSAGPKIALVSDVTIPVQYNGLPVAMIDGNAFGGCRSLKTINLPATLDVISSLDPFAECESLTSINVYSVEGVVTAQYSSVDGVLFENKADGMALLRMPMGREGSYRVPADVCEICEGAFKGSALESVVISKDVTKIANDAFANSKLLKSISFEAAMAGQEKELTIGKRAFANCVALDTFVIPTRLSAIELSKYYIGTSGKVAESSDHAFVGCTSLTSIGVAEGSTTYSAIGGMIYSADGSQLIYCPVARTGEITPELGTQSISAGAFVGCKGITSVVIPNTVTYVGEYAFYGLSVEKVTFGGKGFSSVTIGDNAFAMCKQLSEVVFETGSQISVIGEKAFSGCTALDRFTISSSVTEIRDSAFENCTSLDTVTFEGGKKPLELGRNVFYNCAKLSTVEIPSNVSKIPGIFSGCTSLTEVKVDTNNPYFTSVEGIVFNKDKTEIVYYPQGRGGEYRIPQTVTTIAAGVFNGNTSLSLLVIPNTVSYIGEEAFKGTNIGKILFEGDTYADELVIAKSAFQKAYFEGYDFVLPAHTKEIGEYAFAEIYYQKIVLNEGLETIGDYAFYYPSNDNGAVLEIPASVVSIGKYCFSGETLESSYVTAHRFVTVAFTAENSKLTTIGDYAFYKNTRLTSVTLPDSVKTIGNYAFYECQNLTSVTLSASLETIGAYAFAASANTYQVPISQLYIPAGVSSIGARAFENCQLLKTVIFEGDADSPDLVIGTTYRRSYESDGVEMFSIERGNVFASCTRLLSVELSPNVTVLGDYCFASAGDTGFVVNVPDDSRLTTIGDFCFYKSRLISFTVPASVRSLAPIEEYGAVYDRLGIGHYAFAASAGKLTEIIFLTDSNAYPLTIGYGAFQNQSQLQDIELPNRLATYVSANGEILDPLADGALVFYGARSLSSITTEEGGVYKVEGGVLYTADMKELVFCPVSFDGDVIVPATVTRIHSYAFCDCAKALSITFAGNAVSIIGDYAFFGCQAIKKMILPTSVVSLGEGAFVNASSLESLTLSKSLASFDVAVLSGCTALKELLVEKGSASFISDNGILYNVDKTTLIFYPNGRNEKEYVVDSNVLSIKKGAFAGSVLETIVLPAGLREINEGAFENCTSLSTVAIPISVELIGDRAFANTPALKNITFVMGGTEKLVIGDGAFQSSGVSTLKLPARVAIIGINAFRAAKLSALSFEEADNHQLTEIADTAFAETLLVSVQFPSGLVSLGNSVFLGTKELETVTFGDGLVSVGAEAFKNSAVSEVEFPASLTTLGASAFYSCTFLESVTFGVNSQLQEIEDATFWGCTALKSITIPALVKEIGGAKDNGAFYNCKSLASVIFESDGNCAVIGDYAFYGCASLSEISIPLSVGTLGNYAFAGCASLAEISLPRATVKLGEGLFSGCKKLSNVEMNTGADLLPTKMFENCESLSYIYIPASVAEIGDKCFFGTSVGSFDIATENKNFVSISGIVYNASKTAIVCFPPKLNVTTLIIPKEVVEIKDQNFQYCTSIKEVIFEEGGTAPLTIGKKAFDGCYQIRRIVFPERLVSIGAYAFRECYGLTSITIPKNVESIGDFAFNQCYKLYEVYNLSSITEAALKKNRAVHAIDSNEYIGAKVNIYTPTAGASVIFREGEFVFTTVSGTKRLIGYEGDDSEIILPDGTYEVAPYMFCNDASITKVIIPTSVSMSNNSNFSGCTNLEVVFVKGDIPTSWPEDWNSGKTVFGGYTGEEITYTFVTGDGAPIDSVTTADIVKLPTAVLDGNVFMGWYDNPELIGEPLSGIYYSQQDITLYASFMNWDEYVEAYLRGNSMEYAYETVSGQTYAVKIEEKGAQNYYKLTVNANDQWNITTPSGMGYHKIWVYDANGRKLLEYTSPTTTMYDINYDYTFSKAGTYYIGVGYKDSKKTGTFEVTFTEQ